MRPDPALWSVRPGREPREGLFGEPVTAAIAAVAITLAAILIPGRAAVAALLELLP